MAILLRISVLGIFASAGLALAVSVAVHSGERELDRTIFGIDLAPTRVDAADGADADEGGVAASAPGGSSVAAGREAVAALRPVAAESVAARGPSESSPAANEEAVFAAGPAEQPVPLKAVAPPGPARNLVPPGVALGQVVSPVPSHVHAHYPTFPDHAWDPQAAAYQPLVSNPFGIFKEALEKIQQQQSHFDEALTRLRDELPRITQPAPVAPPASTQPLAAAPLATTEAAIEVEGPEILPPAAATSEPSLSVSEDLLTIKLQNSDIREVLRLLSEASGLNILASPNVQGTVSASMDQVDVSSALEAILKSSGYSIRRDGNFVFVGTALELQGMMHIDDFVSTRVYRPNYVTAVELERLITPMLSAIVGSIAVSEASEVGIGSDSVSVGGDSYAGEEVVLVRDYALVLAEIDQIIHEVDRMPLQVAIEATILSVKLDDKNELGVDFELLRNKDTIRIVSGNPLDALLTANFQDGLKVGFLDSNLFAFVEALETIGDTSVIASPRVMCLNKQRAEILIGSELGYVSTTVTETSATQTVEFLEVGTHLRIRPFISSDGMVRMEVHPELSQGSVRVEGGFTLPDKEVTQVTTNIMCPNGSTIVIGGLIREDLVTSATQIPVLGNLPMVGALFRQRTEETDRREIIVLLTPRIVSESQAWDEGEQYAEQFYDRRDVFVDKMSPFGKRSMGERHVRLARAAWNAGDAAVALRNVNRAIHFDPLNQGAINLRKEIMAVAPDLEVGVDHHLKRGLAPIRGAFPDYSKHGYPWKHSDEFYMDEIHEEVLPTAPLPVDEPVLLEAPDEVRRVHTPATSVATSSRRQQRPVTARVTDRAEPNAIHEPGLFQPTPAVRPVSHEEPVAPAVKDVQLRQPPVDVREG